jgi:hypothetical protein
MTRPEGDIWECKIGATHGPLPLGSDLPMRLAVERAYYELTGHECEFNFSGWGASLTEGELAVVEDRLPDPLRVIAEAQRTIDEAVERIDYTTPVADAASRKDANDART